MVIPERSNSWKLSHSSRARTHFYQSENTARFRLSLFTISSVKFCERSLFVNDERSVIVDVGACV